MARKKQPTTPESSVEQILDAVANVAGRSEKTSWKRKLENMEKLMEKLQPIEDQLLELQAEKAPIIDEIAELREIMVRECVHPLNFLIFKGNHIECKFCNKWHKNAN